jgi:protocatechuate 3,4-dioxygenase beta subunit
VTVSERGLIVPDSGKLVLPEYMKPQEGNHPPPGFSGYKSTALRHPKQPLVLLPQRLTEVTGPLLGDDLITMQDADLTTQHAGEPQGQRIIVSGRVLDSGGKPVPDTLIEIWQTNAAGRYRFITIAPGAYPWGNHYNAWRPAHIHMSLFGRAFTQRLVTQMYFPGDPLLPLDPIYNSVPDEKARALMVAEFSIEDTQPEWALAYRFDIVLRGRSQSVFEGPDDD